MQTPSIAALAALLISPLAHADKFWLGPQTKQEQAVDGSRPDVIVGVVLDQDDNVYHLRVFGGELWLPKKRVSKVEADGLTVAAIAQQENDEAPRLAEAERDRQREHAMWREANANRGGEAAEASARRSDTGAPAAAQEPPLYDAVLHVGEPVRDDTLLRDLDLAYQLTHDHRYIKALRALRRMR